MLDVFADSIEDSTTREVIRDLINELRSNPFIMARGQLLSVSATSAVTNQRYAHQLPFKPKHAVVITPTGSVTVTIVSTTDEAIFITTSAAIEIDLFVGTLSEDL